MFQPPHRALPDAWVTAHILKRMLIEHSIEDLIELTKKPILSKTCHFGQHRGVPWEKVPKSYLHWMKKQKPGFDSDTIFTVDHFLEYCPHCKNGCEKCNNTGFKYPLPLETAQ
jgi:exodeoxyribonuclease X